MRYTLFNQPQILMLNPLKAVSQWIVSAKNVL